MGAASVQASWRSRGAGEGGAFLSERLNLRNKSVLTEIRWVSYVKCPKKDKSINTGGTVSWSEAEGGESLG